jgi:NADPH-dependent ferric siderophore reductase
MAWWVRVVSSTDAALSAEDLAELEHTLEHFNANHADTVLLLARFGAGCGDAVTADAAAVDAFGVDLDVETSGGAERARLRFDEPATSTEAVVAAVLGKIADCRAVAGDTMPETSMEHELRVNPTLPTHVTSVETVTDLTPNLRQLTLRGGLERFRPLGGDHFAYLMVPSERMGGRFRPGFSIGDVGSLPPDDRPIGAYYTIRRWDEDSRTITLWVVLHGHDEGVAGWSARCRPGDEVALWGPRVSLSISEPVGDHLLVTDETGFGAVASLIDQIGTAGRVSVIAETIDASHTIELSDGDLRSMTWCFRDGDEPGTTGRLLDAVLGASFDPATTTVFVAGESREVTAIRKHLRNRLQMPSDRVHCTGYWRRAAT